MDQSPPAAPDEGFSQDDLRHMRRALVLARRGLGHVSPNPPVGCVIAFGPRVVAEGWHARFGGPHAEAAALAAAGPRARGATAYVTLTPCAHFGKTPPCADALVRAGIVRVVVAHADPNPKSAGGLERLRDAGIDVRTGLLAGRAAELMRGYLRAGATGLPFVTLKYAMTLDGRIAAAGGDSRWVSGEAARRLVHRWRARADAVLVGVGTVLADDPSLNVRFPARIEVPPENGNADGDGYGDAHGSGKTRHPLRVVFDTHARTPADARLFSSEGGRVVIVAGTAADPARCEALRRAGATVEKVATTPDAEGGGGKKASVDARAALARLVEAHGVHTVLCEGGAGLAGALIDGGLANEAAVFVAPKIVGGARAPGPVGGAGAARMADARVLRNSRFWLSPPDCLVVGRLD